MLITAFAAGELSENLFGRTDLPPYFQGAARIENFDIIPSGGIEKRAGTRRILGLPGGGRLVPFVISRAETYLLYFTDQHITVYRAGRWDAPKAVFANAGGPGPEPLYTAGELGAVQHAQHFNIMVLVHENHPPLAIVRTGENTLEIAVFAITIGVTVEAAEGVDTAALFEFDETYAKDENRYLKAAGRYPRAVTFMNSRLVFAGTKETPQRIFASRVNDIHDFSTYKIYAAERRDYILVEGARIDLDSGVITIPDSQWTLFTREYTRYYIDLPSFYEEGTMIACNDGGRFYMTRPIKPLPVSQSMINDYIAVKNSLEAADEQTGWKGGQTIRDSDWVDGDWTHYSVFMLHYKIGVIRIRHTHWRVSWFNDSATYPAEELLVYVNGRDRQTAITDYTALYNLVKDRWNQWKTVSINHEAAFSAGIGLASVYFAQTMRYQVDLPGAGAYVLYGTPGEILQQLSGQINYANRIVTRSTPFYAKEQTLDRYPVADDGFTFEVSSDRNDAINWLVMNKYLIAGTETAEYVMPADMSAVNLYARLNSFYGSSPVQAASAGDAALFFRGGNRGLVEYYIPQADNYFRTNDLLYLAGQMLRESETADYDIVTSPYTRVIVIRADGTVAALLYDRAFGVFAWPRYSGAGAVKSLAAAPGQSGYDDLYLLAERDGAYFLVCFEPGARVFLDSYTPVTQAGWAQVIAGYDTARARVSRIAAGADGKSVYEDYPADAEPDWSRGGQWYIGYPYRSAARTMPVLANNQLKKQRITGLSFRFLNSYLPKATSTAGGKPMKTDTITNLIEPFSGVRSVPFPGAWGGDVQAELIHDTPGPVTILAINAEAQ